MMDWLESMEMAAERRMDEATKGIPEGKFRCCCGSIALLKEAAPASDSPYAMPVCRSCGEKDRPE